MTRSLQQLPREERDFIENKDWPNAYDGTACDKLSSILETHPGAVQTAGEGEHNVVDSLRRLTAAFLYATAKPSAL